MKKSRFIIIVCLCCIVYSVFIYMEKKDNGTGASPMLDVPESVLVASVKDNEKKLLKDVKASDKEDGDITSKVFIESISEFDENKERLITYAVFDNDDHITRATRKMKYKDYQAPKFDILIPLTTVYYGNENYFLNHISATSSVDGNITSKVSFTFNYEETKTSTIQYTVEDSCGVQSSINLNVHDFPDTGTIDIELYEHLIYVPVGTNLTPSAYIKGVNYMGMESDEMIHDIKIHTDYDKTKKGTYEVIYDINGDGGEYGATKMVVVVE